MNNDINKLLLLFNVHKTKKLLVRSTSVGPYLIIFP